MRATCRSGRYTKSGRHNDRSFDVSKADHIDQERVKNNYYWHIAKDKSKSFEEMELDYYRKHFKEHLDARNTKNRLGGHPERVISMSDYKRKQRSCPDEVLLQIGSLKDGTVEPSILGKCMREYVIEFNKRYGAHCTILNVAVHLDEATPHCHIRRVWHCKDELGNECVNQKKALCMLGFERPNKEKPEDRHNNAKQSFSKEERMLFLDICEAHGLNIEREPLAENSRERLETKDFKLQRDIEAKKDELEHLEKLVKKLQAIIEALLQNSLEIALQVVKDHERKQEHARGRSR